MTDEEANVIEAAIGYVNQRRHGLYRDTDKHFDVLTIAVDRLEMENDGEWQRYKLDFNNHVEDCWCDRCMTPEKLAKIPEAKEIEK